MRSGIQETSPEIKTRCLGHMFLPSDDSNTKRKQDATALLWSRMWQLALCKREIGKIHVCSVRISELRCLPIVQSAPKNMLPVWMLFEGYGATNMNVLIRFCRAVQPEAPSRDWLGMHFGLSCLGFRNVCSHLQRRLSINLEGVM